MDDQNFEDQLSHDLRAIADDLRQHRPVADGHLLERVSRRLTGGRPSRRRRWVPRPRAAGSLVCALALVIAAQLTHLNVAQALTSLTSSITSSTSVNSPETAAGDVYCGTGSASGSTGWAPTFRWYYGSSSSTVDGWAPSTQPACPGGSLIIPWSDSLTVAPGSTVRVGYDFHTNGGNNINPYTMTANPTVVFNSIACADHSTPTQSTITDAMPTATYNSASGQWVPSDAAATQGNFTVPDICHGANVILKSGTFSALIKLA